MEHLLEVISSKPALALCSCGEWCISDERDFEESTLRLFIEDDFNIHRNSK